jgi:trimethyllysine dioxygenase
MQTDPSGIQLFHLLEHTEGSGGATLLVDSFYVASILRDLYPEAYRLLSTVPIAAHAAGESAILYRATRLPLEHDAAGNLRAVRWNNADRGVLRGVSYADVPKLYEAMRTWDNLITSQDSEYWVQLSSGTAIGMGSSFFFLSTYTPPFVDFHSAPFWTMDTATADSTVHRTAINNHRVLHGRSAFMGKRRMCGAYIGADEYRSRLAVLSEQFGSSADETTTRARERGVWSHDF